MKHYRWKGPVQALTITHESKELELRLAPDHEVELPEQHPMVQCWLAAGDLEEVSARHRKLAKQQKKEQNNA